MQLKMNMTIIIKKNRVLLATALLATFSSFLPEASAQTPVPTATPAAPDPEASPVPTAAPVAPVAPETPAAAPVAAPSTGATVGGYGELHYANVNGPSDGAEIDFHRFVIYLGHRFDDRLSFRSELEIEHGGEEVELEQAFLEYSYRRWLGLRGGLLLVPIGILNAYHEPPTFHGVERNTVDTVLVPTTWGEGGAALFGEPIDGLRYQVAFFNGLNAGGFSGNSGIRGGRSATSESASNDGAVAVRLDYSPILGLDAGATYFEGGAGRQEIEESVSIRLVEADVRFQRMGIGVRAQVVRAWIEGAEALNDYLTAGADPVAPIGSQLEGYYAELAYDVFSIPREILPILGEFELHPFVRYEHTNTQLEMPGAYLIDDSFDRSITTAGLTFKPVSKVAIKADYQWTWTKAGDPPNVWHLGFGYMF